jgi:sugar transferase (PEP-CTERM/EpsH1 system associated)
MPSGTLPSEFLKRFDAWFAPFGRRRRRRHLAPPEPASRAVEARSATEIKIAHVVLSLDLGGMERVVLELVREGLRRGQQPSVICLTRKGALAPQAEALGAEVLCLDKPEGLRFETFRRVRAALRRLGPDVVHTHQIGALFYAGPASLHGSTPAIVHTEHGKHYSHRLRTRWLGRLAGRYADKFCCVSQDIAEEVRQARIVSWDKIEVVPNGIDTTRFGRQFDSTALRRELGMASDAPVVGTIGRLNEVKCQDLLVRAFASLASNRREAHLVVVGDGPMRGELEQLAASLTAAGRIHFVGCQDDPERWLQLMDVFALTSRSEGMPLAILEAWAASRPVVASRVGGVGQMVEHGETGFLFDSGDESALTDALLTLLDQPWYARRLAESGRRRVRCEFDVRNMADAYEAIYRELLPRSIVAEPPLQPGGQAP